MAREMPSRTGWLKIHVCLAYYLLLTFNLQPKPGPFVYREIRQGWVQRTEGIGTLAVEVGRDMPARTIGHRPTLCRESIAANKVVDPDNVVAAIEHQGGWWLKQSTIRRGISAYPAAYLGLLLGYQIYQLHARSRRAAWTDALTTRSRVGL